MIHKYYNVIDRLAKIEQWMLIKAIISRNRFTETEINNQKGNNQHQQVFGLRFVYLFTDGAGNACC